MKIVVTNSSVLNGGDAAILFALAKLLQARFGQNLSLEVLDSYGAVAQRIYPELHIQRQISFPPSSWPAVFRRGPMKPMWRRYVRWNAEMLRERGLALKLPQNDRAVLEMISKADVVVSTGGTYLVEGYDVSPRLLELEIAAAAGTPFVLWTQSIDYFRRERTRKRVARVLSAAEVVLLRDRRSMDNVIRMGVDGRRCAVHSDVAFALAEPATLEHAASRRLSKANPRVVVSVRNWQRFKNENGTRGMERYERAMAAAIAWLVEHHGASVVMLSSCQGIPEYAYDDSRTARRIVDRLPGPLRSRVQLDADFHRPTELLEMLGSADFVIATRMHVAILSLCAGVPVVPIAYEFKTKELFSGLGRPDSVLDIDSVSGEGLVQALRAFLSTVDDSRAELFERVAQMRESAVASIGRLEQCLVQD